MQMPPMKSLKFTRIIYFVQDLGPTETSNEVVRPWYVAFFVPLFGSLRTQTIEFTEFPPLNVWLGYSANLDNAAVLKACSKHLSGKGIRSDNTKIYRSSDKKSHPKLRIWHLI